MRFFIVPLLLPQFHIIGARKGRIGKPVHIPVRIRRCNRRRIPVMPLPGDFRWEGVGGEECGFPWPEAEGIFTNKARLPEGDEKGVNS